MKLFKWDNGRQETGYRIFTLLFSKWLNMDAYIIHYGVGSYVPMHVDEIPKGKMYRLNIELIRPKSGGRFYCDKIIFNLFDRIIFFRPDQNEHLVSHVIDGNRWVLSFGKVI